MRSIAVLLLVGFASPVFAQEERGGVLDEYFACLVGQGAVDILHGGDAASGWVAAIAACVDEQKAVEAHSGFADADAAHDRVVDVGSFAMHALEALSK
jgi:hypothetical protein